MSLDDRTRNALFELNSLVPKLRNLTALTPDNYDSLSRLFSILGNETDVIALERAAKYGERGYLNVIQIAESVINRYNK